MANESLSGDVWDGEEVIGTVHVEIDPQALLGRHLDHMRCPYLIVHGGYDVLSVDQAQKVYDYATAHEVNVTLKLLTEQETGAEHCQHDNPTIGQEIMADWLVDIFAIDERALMQKALAPML